MRQAAEDPPLRKAGLHHEIPPAENIAFNSWRYLPTSPYSSSCDGVSHNHPEAKTPSSITKKIVKTAGGELSNFDILFFIK
jgi:hypothetical protein